MNLHSAQAVIASDRHRFRVVNCGRRFGKTTLAVLEMVAKAIYGNDRNICYVAPTYAQARDIAWLELKKICQPIANKINESRLEITLNTTKGGTSVISLRGWESIETLRGQKFHFIVVDEIASMRNWWANWQEVIRPTLTDYKGEALFISTPKGFNHFYDIYNLQDKDIDYKSFHFTSYDNPHIPFEELEKAKLEVTEDRFAQEYMADFRKTEGLVYKEFNRERHIYSDQAIMEVERLAGVDWGFTNPASSHLIRKDTDRHYWISNEFYKTGQTTSQIIEHVKSLRPHKVYPDPAEPDRNEEARRAGLNVREVTKDVEAGINCVRELFKQDRLHIHNSCVHLIQELETYSYPEKKPDHNEPEAPIKENDHALDEIRYVLYMQEGKTNHGTAHTHYPSNTMPRNNITPIQVMQGLPPELNKEQPRIAYTHTPNLRKY
jgi:PBSX family phage terminase large subunit